MAVGWSRAVGYWVHPVLRVIGPVPAVAWIPIAFFVFPTSGSASTFLIALATFFPTAVLTWSGVAAVSNAYYDVARTMGASPWFLVRRVPVPAAMPSVFVGLFMGLGASFSVLVVAEMLGLTASSEASRRDRRETPATSRSPRRVGVSPIADATPDRTVLMAIAK